MNRLLSLLIPLILLCGHSAAQISVDLKPVKKDLVRGEAVVMEITISNHTGSSIELKNRGNMPWLDINISRTEGHEALPQSRFANFPSVTIPAGKKVSKKVDMRHLYDLNKPSYYKAQAIVRSPDGRNIYPSPKALFNINEGAQIWAQKLVTPGGSKCFYNVCSQTENEKQRLYVQVRDGDTDIPINTVPVGEWLSFSPPICKIDSRSFLHILFQSTPQYYSYAIIAPNGNRQTLSYYHKVPGMAARLANLPDGNIKVEGAVYFDPKARPKKTIRDATVIPK